MSTEPPTERPTHSADHLWWWNGRSWVPAVSPDFSSWFDGEKWVPTPAFVRRPQPETSASRVLNSPWMSVLFFVGMCAVGTNLLVEAVRTRSGDAVGVALILAVAVALLLWNLRRALQQRRDAGRG